MAGFQLGFPGGIAKHTAAVCGHGFDQICVAERSGRVSPYATRTTSAMEMSC